MKSVNLCKEYSVETIVVGLPKNMNGFNWFCRRENNGALPNY